MRIPARVTLAITPLQCYGRTSDLGSLYAFLCGDAARYITGTDILVDGGGITTYRSVENKINRHSSRPVSGSKCACEAMKIQWNTEVASKRRRKSTDAKYCSDELQGR